jgi:hypothetical protein
LPSVIEKNNAKKASLFKWVFVNSF